jgi:DNA-directed RNA polymerase subunit N
VRKVIIPVRCFSCGGPVADKYEEFKERTAKGEEPKAVMDSLGVGRYCCRRMLLTHVELLEEVIKLDEQGL